MKKILFSLLTFLLFAASGPFVSAEIDQTKKNEILTAKDQAILLEVIQTPGSSEDEIFMKGIACRRLAVIGNAEAVPVLAKMLGEDIRLSYFARYALEMMPFENVNPVLLDGAKNIGPKDQRLGCILSLGVRKCATAVPVLKEIAANPKTTCDRKAAYAALGMIATEDAANFLIACAKTTPETEDFLVRKRLADAILDCAEAFEKAGNPAKAAEIYDSVVIPVFPVFAQKAGAYHGLLCRQAASAAVLVTKLESPKECCFTGGLKTIREYSAEAGETITKTCVAELPKLSVERRALVIRAIADRKDEASRKLAFAALKELGKSTEFEIQLAVIQGMKKLGTLDPLATREILRSMPASQFSAEQLSALYAAKVETISALKSPELDAAIAANLPNMDLKNVYACAYFEIVGNRRITAMGPGLVKAANAEGILPEVRDRVLGALSEIVTLESLNLLVEALNGETDDAKVEWILRSACTRLPREDCAAAVVKMFDAESDPVEKAKLLTLLKQIGGKTALACVEKACWNDVTADAATRTLGTWNTPDDALGVADACLKLAKECPTEKFQIRAIRSYVRIPRQFDLPKEKKFEMCRTAFETAKRPEDKMLVFEVFTRVIDVASARAAMTYAEDSAYREAAYSSVIAIAKKFQGKSEEFKAILKKVAETSKNAETKAQALTIAERL